MKWNVFFLTLVLMKPLQAFDGKRNGKENSEQRIKFESSCSSFASCEKGNCEEGTCLNGVPLPYGKCLCHFGFSGARCETMIQQRDVLVNKQGDEPLGREEVCYGDECSTTLLNYKEDCSSDPHSLQWEIIPRWRHCKPLRDLIQKDDILDGNFVAISTGLCNAKSELFAARDVKSPVQRNIYRFSFVPETTGGKSRLELSTCFTTGGDLIAANHSTLPCETEHLLKTSCPVSNIDINHVHNYSYEIYLPKMDCDVTGQYIITQWHGSPDPTILQDEFGCLSQIPIEDFRQICAIGRCKEGKIFGGDGRFTGLRYNHGGYPPLTMMLKDEKFLIVARSDERAYIPKKGCSFRGTEAVKCEAFPRQQHHLLWNMPAEIFPFNKWLKFQWKIKWSRYGLASKNDNPGNRVSDAQVLVWMNGVNIIDWVGPCGRNDNGRTPYFKAGIYNPSGSDSPFVMFFRRFQHYHGSKEDDEKSKKRPKHLDLKINLNQNKLSNLEPLEFDYSPSLSNAKCILSPSN